MLAFIVAVAAASLATLGILNLSDGSSSSAPKTTAAISGGPSTAKRSAAKPKAAASKEAAKPKTAPKAKTVAKPKTAVKAKTVAKKPTTVVKEKTTANKPTTVAKKPTTKPKATTKPQQTTKPKAPASTPVTKPASKPKPQQTTPKPAAAEPRRFAWAPVEGAVSYHVELFRGADRVLVKETTEPILELGSTWRYEGKTVELTPGSYRWYVWPVTKSGRATQAVVQAKLDVP